MDSGIGGLGIWAQIQKILPNESLVYFADCNRFPYGEKSQKELKRIIRSVLEYLLREYSIKLLVLACNTATVSSIDFLRREYPELPIVGVVPVIKPASLLSQKKKIACLATDTTLKSSSQAQLIETFAHSVEVQDLVSSGLVELIEKQDHRGIQKSLAVVLAPLKEGYLDVLALGCTHYTLIRKEIAEFLPPEIEILDSNEAVSRQVYRRLHSEGLQVSHSENLRYSFVVHGEHEECGKYGKKENFVRFLYSFIGTNGENKENKEIDTQLIQIEKVTLD